MKSNLHSAQNFIGTSGWSYGHWKENFYPGEIKQADWLKYYSSVFSTVEVNTTFYHVPLLSTVKKWKATVSENFSFSIKASRYITHQKRLHDCKESLAYLFSHIDQLKNKMGPILFQLPPSFHANKDLLADFINLLNKKHRYVFEFRHLTWFEEDIYELLSKKNIALCITDLNGKLTPEVITADFTYLRLHGPKRAYQGSYGPVKLRAWKKKIQKWNDSGTSVYCYFDNDEKGYAIEDARTIQDYLNK